MLNGNFVGCLDGLLQLRHYKDMATICECLLRDGNTGKNWQLLSKFGLHGIRHVHIRHHGNGQGLGVVFGLGEHICCNKGWFCRGIGDDQHFAWPGEHINTHSSHHLPFGFCHILISRSGNNINWQNRFRAKGKGGNGPGGTEFVHLVNTNFPSRH